MAHPPYSATVTVTNGSPTVTAVTATFVNSVIPGDWLRGPDEKMYFVLGVTSNTLLTLDRNYQGTTTTTAVLFAKHSEQWSSNAQSNTLLAQMLGALQQGFSLISTTSNAIATAATPSVPVAVTWTATPGQPILPGVRLRASSRANPTVNFQSGVMTAYDPSTGSLTLSVDYGSGSGTFTDWNIGFDGAVGPQGPAGVLTAPLVTPGGRLTLSSAAPVMTADSTTSTTLYYLPYTADIVPIYNGTSWDQWQFTSLSLALDATAHPAAAVFDIAAINDSGTPRLVALPAYSALNARSAAVSRRNGLMVNSATVTCSYGSSTVSVPARRATILGTVQMTAAGSITYAQQADAASAPCRLSVCNLYNSVSVTARLILSTSSYTYATNAPQAWNGLSTARIETVNCDAGAVGARIPVWLSTGVSTSSAGSIFRIAIGWDSATGRATVYSALTVPIANYQMPLTLADSIGQVGSNGVGAHYIAPLEVAASGTATIYGNAYTALSATLFQ